MFIISLTVSSKDLASIKRMPNEFKSGLTKGLRRGMLFAEGKAKRRFDTPGNLKVRTGHYRRSIRSGVRSGAGGTTGYLAADVVYASIHEYGGIIRPKEGEYLTFPIEGKWVSVRRVIIPKRPLMTPSITENIVEIGNIIAEDIIKELGD